MSQSTIEYEIEELAGLSDGQASFFRKVLEGKNVFLTGKAGTGKSTVVRRLMDYLKDNGAKVVAVAPTGIAAINIGGQTIHSLFGINPFGVANFESCNMLRGEKRRLLKAIQVIFVDEVSMLRPDVLDAINWSLKKNGCGGLETKQIVFVGDMKQLPVILDDNERSVLFQSYDGEEFTNADIFPKLEVETVDLDEVLRQSDPEFIEALNKVRDGGKSDYFRQFLTDKAEGIILAPHNDTVRLYNENGLASQEGEIHEFKAVVEGNVRAEDFNMETYLKVKDGCPVMYLANSKNNELSNGTLGTFVVKTAEGGKKKFFIRVKTVEYALEKFTACKRQYVYNRSKDALELQDLGSITQYPIRLAYALSIHKSQGLTFDNVTVDITLPCFQKGQLYVALSRVTAPAGLKIICKRIPGQ